MTDYIPMILLAVGFAIYHAHTVAKLRLDNAKSGILLMGLVLSSTKTNDLKVLTAAKRVIKGTGPRLDYERQILKSAVKEYESTLR